MARIAVAILALAAIVQLAGTATRAQARDALRRYWPVAAGFLIGYAPVLLYSLLVEPARSPARVANLQQLVDRRAGHLRKHLPDSRGFQDCDDRAASVPLAPSSPAPRPSPRISGSFARPPPGTHEDFFALFVVFFPAAVPGERRVPRHAVLPLFHPLVRRPVGGVGRGKPRVSTRAKRVASIIVAAIIAVHAWQQAIWYQKLQPDTQSLATIDCLKRNGIRGGFAEYWTGYKLTFIAQEEIVIAPTDGIDRYPRYTEFVGSLPASSASMTLRGVTSQDLIVQRQYLFMLLLDPDQCRKCRLPVNTIARPCSSAAAITSLSRSDPPG